MSLWDQCKEKKIRTIVIYRLHYADTTFGLEVIGIRGGTTSLPGLLR